MSIRGFTKFDEDPFFEGHSERMKDFGGSFLSDFMLGWPAINGELPALQEERSTRRDAAKRGRDEKAVARADDLWGFGGMFNSVHRQMNDMMRSMMSFPEQAMKDLPAGGADSHSYMQSSMYSYNNTGEGSPQVYEAHKSRRTAPGGVAEEKRAVKDTSRNLEKMRVSRRIKDREHAVQKSRRTDTNEMEQHQELVGMAEDDVEKFKKEWHDVTSGMGFWGDEFNRRHANRVRDERHRPRAIENSKARSKY